MMNEAYDRYAHAYPTSAVHDAELLALPDGGWQLQWRRLATAKDRAEGVRGARLIDWVNLRHRGESLDGAMAQTAKEFAQHIPGPVLVLVRDMSDILIGVFVCRGGAVLEKTP